MIDAPDGQHPRELSEQFAITDDERDVLTRTILDHVAGRVPVIVTTSHYSTPGARRAACARSSSARRW